MKPITRAYLELHTAVFLFGFTAILGKLIELSAVVMVWWRVLITSLSLLLVVNIFKLVKELPRPILLQFMGVGVIVGLHWVTFYGSVKLSNASICLVCFATTSLFTSFLEPLILKQKINWFEIALSLLILPGMILIVNGIEWDMMLGMAVGVLSAFLASLFSVLNKKLIDKTDSLSITLLELGSAWLFLCLVLPVYFIYIPEALWMPTWKDMAYLLVLSLLCTTLAYVLNLRALKHISAFASNLTINLEPVYGIVLAWFILGENEQLSVQFYWGAVIITLAVFAYPFIKKRYFRVSSSQNNVIE